MKRTGLRFKVANEGERAGAIELQSSVYEETYGLAPEDDSAHPGAHYLVALDLADVVVASARLVGFEYRPFDVEEFVDLTRILVPGRSFAMAGRLCLRADQRRMPESVLILGGLLRLASRIASANGWTDLVIYTPRALVDFYRGASFEEMGCSFFDPRWNLEFHLMRLDLSRLENRLAKSRN